MNPTPFLSVIMPVYNSEDYLQNAIDSVKNQSFTDWELICVNDNSQDNSLIILENNRRKDNRIRVINSPRNIGAGFARNLALEKIRGEYVTFLDSDDTVNPGLYEKVYSAVKSFSPHRVVWGLSEIHTDKNGKPFKKIPITEKQGFFENRKMVEKVLSLEEKTLFGYQWNSAYKADIIRENGIAGEPVIFYEDYFFNLKFCEHSSNIYVLDFLGSNYYKRKNKSVTHTFTEAYFPLSYRRIESMYAYCLKGGIPKEQIEKALSKRFARYIYSALSRNCDKRSKLNFRERKDFIETLFKSDMYKKLIETYNCNFTLNGLMIFPLKHKSVNLLSLLGRMIYKWKGL